MFDVGFEFDRAMDRIRQHIDDRLAGRELTKFDIQPIALSILPRVVKRRIRPERLDELWYNPDQIERVANLALKSFDHAVKNRHKSLRGFDSSELSEIHLFGMLITKQPELGRCVVDMTTGLPSAAIAWNYTGVSEGLSKKWNVDGITTVHTATHLPQHVIAGGPGIPYVVNGQVRFKDGRLQGHEGWVTIDKDGIIYPTKHYETVKTSIRTKNGWATVPSVQLVTEVGRHYEPDLKREIDVSPVRVAADILHAWKEQKRYWVAVVSDDRGAVRFQIDPMRVGAIFRDSRYGVRKMHWVRAHMRESISTVRTHLRGAEKFSWRNFQVSVFMPGEYPWRKNRAMDLTFDERVFAHIEPGIYTMPNQILAKLLNMTYVPRSEALKKWKESVADPINYDLLERRAVSKPKYYPQVDA